MILRRDIRSRKCVLFVVIGVLIGFSGGFFVQVIFRSYEISGYEKNISFLESEVKRLSSTLNGLNDEVSLLNRKAYILYGNVTVEQAWRLIEVVEPLVILDVRTPLEYEEGHIEGAINIPVTSLLQRIGELNRENEILVYCGLGVCSSRALTILNSYNFPKVYSILGGIETWKQAGYPVV